MSLEFNCIECSKRLRVRAELVGALTKCPQCETVQTAGQPPQTEEPIIVASVAEPNPFAETNAADNPYKSPPTSSPVQATYPSPHLSRPLVAGQLPLAAPGIRIIATMVDWFLFAMAATPGVVLTNLLDEVAPGFADAAGSSLTGLGVLALASYQWFKISYEGQSIGKRLLHIRIVDASGSPPGFLMGVLVRYGLSSILWAVAGLFTLMCLPLALILLIAEAVLLFSNRHQCTHDMLASTFVVQGDA